VTSYCVSATVHYLLFHLNYKRREAWHAAFEVRWFLHHVGNQNYTEEKDDLRLCEIGGGKVLLL
jgi:hypothetical protein